MPGEGRQPVAGHGRVMHCAHKISEHHRFFACAGQAPLPSFYANSPPSTARLPETTASESVSGTKGAESDEPWQAIIETPI